MKPARWPRSACALAAALAAFGLPALAADTRADETADTSGAPFRIVGSWEVTHERRRNFDLNRAAARDRRVNEHEVKVGIGARPRPDTEVFVQAVGTRETKRTQGTAATAREKALARGQTWVKQERIAGSGWLVQAGRVPLSERRTWWWDDDLDAVRTTGVGTGWRLDTGLARELMRVSSAEPRLPAERRGVTRWFGQATWQLADRHALDVFWLRQFDRSGQHPAGTVVAGEADTDPSDLRGGWFGLRASGDWRGGDGSRLVYWADSAALRGREAVTGYTEGADGRFTAGSSATRRVRGHAVDLGATLSVDLPLRPALTVALARGSGGTRTEARDANFRQTGLQENKVRFGGVKRLMRYGELLQPELSNLAVTTVGASLRLAANTSVDVVAHRYRQLVPSTTLVGSRLSTAPLGTSGDIGRALDVVLAVREWEHVELTLRWSRFTPGTAFADDRRDPAHALELGLALDY